MLFQEFNFNYNELQQEIKFFLKKKIFVKYFLF